MLQQSGNLKGRDYRLIVATACSAALALLFWLGSRYPALNEKALMGGDSPISGLSFDILLEIFPDSGIWWEFVANTANWIYTNLYGMTFGVLFGAAALTLLSVVKSRAFKNGFANAALGTAIGAPLGVCVNCAMPIALGLHAGRMRLETTLSALLASPTLNVIVISMSFALLPFHLAFIKLGLALAMVLLVVPLLCRFVLRAETDTTRYDLTSKPQDFRKINTPSGVTGWIARALAPVDLEEGDFNTLRSAVWFSKTYARSFLFVLIITVPLMFLAAILGSIVTVLVDIEGLVRTVQLQSNFWLVFVMVITALLTSFVPAPIALDVILTVILLNLGLRADVAMVALVGLGSFSIYPFIILWRAISLKTAAALWVSVVGMAVTAGVLVALVRPYAEAYYDSRQIQALNAVKSIDWPIPQSLPEPMDSSELRQLISSQAVESRPVVSGIETSSSSKIRISRYDDYRSDVKNEPKVGSTHFNRIIGSEIGLAELGVSSPIRQFGYHLMMGALAAGDVHGDGWSDIITRRPDHAVGLTLYANIQGKFVRQKMDLGPVDNLEVFNLALADIDGDAQLDLFISTIQGGSYLFYNENGTFDANNMIVLKAAGHDAVASVAFADLDTDGDLDIVLGNWAPRGMSEGWILLPEHIRNEIWWNDGNEAFRAQTMDGVPGQTLTTVISDIDDDGFPDLLKGDDAGASDEVVFFGKEGRIRHSTREQQPFNYFLLSSMSYAEGDWNNDLRSDFYGAQIAMGDSEERPDRSDRSINVRHICRQFGADLGWGNEQVNDCSKELLSQDLIRSRNSGKGLDSCGQPSTTAHRALCGAASALGGLENSNRNLAGDRPKYEECSALLANMPRLQRLCLSLLEPIAFDKRKPEHKRKKQNTTLNANILMTGMGGANYVDKARETGVQSPGWSWNSKFKDLDQDGRQDLLVMTGIWFNSREAHTNVFYRNNGDGFTDGTDAFGFHDVVPSLSYVGLDYDRDGDIDIVRDNSALRMIVHRNDRPAGGSLWVNLRDGKGNSMGIGARVTICVDGETVAKPGKCQMRHIKASGGFMSSDPINAHFGLGAAKSISLIQVRWPDGEITKILPTKLSDGEIFIHRD